MRLSEAATVTAGIQRILTCRKRGGTEESLRANARAGRRSGAWAMFGQALLTAEEWREPCGEWPT